MAFGAPFLYSCDEGGLVRLLLIEDNAADADLARIALMGVAPDVELEVAGDGAVGLHALREGMGGEQPYDAVLLDLKLPKKGGLEVLEDIKGEPGLRRLPVLVLTSSRAPADVARAYELQAAACFAKPLAGYDDLMATILAFLRSALAPPRATALPVRSVAAMPRPQAHRPSRPEDDWHRAIVESSAVAIVGMDLESNIRSWNHAAEALYGYREEEVLGRRIDVLIPQERLAEVHGLLGRITAGSPSEYLETVRVDRHGREIQVALTVSPIRDRHGQLVGKSAIVRDITARKQAEEKFRLAVESAPSGMIMVDADGTIVLVNAEAERMFGYGRQELVGRSIDMLVPTRYRDAHPHERASFMATPRSRRMGAGRELFALRKDGSEFPIEIGLNPIHTPEGLFVLSSVVDITERLRAEEMFRLAVQASPSGIAMVDPDGTIVLVNAETERMFGYERDELVGQSIDVLVPQRFRGQHGHHRAGFLDRPTTRAMGTGRDLFGLRKDGTELPVEIGLNPIRTEQGLVILSTIVDITERKQAERALTDQAQELARSNADLEQFAYVASHDLREPLRMVASFTRLLAERYGDALDADAHKYIEYAREGATRMQRLIDDLLTYSRVRTQARPPAPVSSKACLQRAMENLQLRLKETGGRVTWDEGLPEVPADDTQLAMVFQNLLENALKFRREVPPHIQVRAHATRHHFTFSVQDNGIGIAAEHFDRIFQVFQRLHGRDEYPGTGIGLALCKRIVEQHGGTIWVESDGATGSTFYFTLPASVRSRARPE
jgi:PAS domain S-box-containing protein